ncbi:MAG: hypothetical protein ACKO2D_13315 [Chloroflexota bacterium]|nr:hypothetical protein [Chloroflexota bacterium]
MIGDVIFGVAMILIVGIGMLLLDRGDLRMTDALDLVAVREVRVVRGGDVIVGIVGRGGLQVLVRSHLEVVGGLAVVIGGVVVEFVFALGNHVPGFLPVCEPPHGLSWALA